LVPPAAEGPHQRDGALVLRRAYLQRLAPVAQLAALRVEQLELADVAVAVARVGQRGGAACALHRAPLGLRLLREEAQRGELVFDVLESPENLLAGAHHLAFELRARAL